MKINLTLQLLKTKNNENKSFYLQYLINKIIPNQITPVARMAFLVLSIIGASDNSVAVTQKGLSSLKLSDKAVQSAFAPKRLMLFIGINEFLDSKFPTLKFPSKDVSDFSSFLKEHNSAKEDEFIYRIGASATLNNVTSALDHLEAANTSEEDTVIIYFSTHGTLDYNAQKQLSRYAVLYDTNFENVSNSGLSIDFISQRLSRLKSKRKALILALCHSGSGKSTLPRQIVKEARTLKAGFFPKPFYQASAAMMVLSASGWNEPAREDEKLMNDIYTHYLIKGLNRNDSNQDGGISLFEAHEYARSKTYDYTRGQQTPSALVNLQGMDPIILNGTIKKDSHPLIFADNEQYRDLEVYVNGKAKGSLWQPKLASNGRIKLTLIDPKFPGTPLMDHQVYLSNNTSYSVSSLIARPPSYALELSLYRLPIGAKILGLTVQSQPLFGFGFRANEVFGSANAILIKAHTNSSQTDVTIDYQKTAMRQQILSLRGDLTRNYFPIKNLSLNLGIGLETLQIKRVYANPSLEHEQQSIRSTYPILFSELQWLQIINNLYAGMELSIYPMRNISIRIEDQSHSLEPLSARMMFGFML
ncbi:MAG: caspase family protein [Bdellovibrionota bacterium]